MPIKTGFKQGKCYVKWGDSGKEYFYECGNEQAKKAAIKKAEQQAIAIRSSGYKE